MEVLSVFILRLFSAAVRSTISVYSTLQYPPFWLFSAAYPPSTMAICHGLQLFDAVYNPTPSSPSPTLLPIFSVTVTGVASNFFISLPIRGDQAGAVYVKLAECYIKLDSTHEAANAYADAAHCYKKTNTTECISRLEQALELFMELGRLNMSARYCKEIAELYEQEENMEQAMVYYDKAADLYQGEDSNSSANTCRLKIAQYAAELEQYQKAIEIYEDIARQAINNNLLKYGVRGHLLNAGICQLCKGDFVAITNALEKYQDLDPTFGGSREHRLLVDLAASIDEEDVEKFTDAIKDFDSITKLDAWRTTLLLRVKDILKAKELEEDDLT